MNGLLLGPMPTRDGKQNLLAEHKANKKRPNSGLSINEDKNMPNTGLFGPYPFNQENLSLYVAGKGAGVYALDRTTDGGFKVHYVGRSDDDLPDRLGDHLDEGYAYFKYGYFDTPKAAFAKECQIYHDFNPPDNVVHPAKPPGVVCSCPVAECEN
ncbi:MAG TPA: hypothetical protein VJ723_02925 [Candidatus Angelobacter sp.]|nr:hypothetical protein [Candidatus Angelobacter sp.]